ncbi:hypothetical protein [Micromonospora yangpuensis]|uniref:Uncharacterized protein n=1 Tax=Micromonospora yangpuensis TaxID=683228 RepID=A0A1C6VET9_9ACTN|nr:hypothetical protein [Micromonospora yangpuensis]GGM14447.1 hypothetical protein GCM10012279_35700 [Micromonospora yangpuensis]SCL64667.1 hypothetical protein GA0070617_5526 [Micromonospora yangpuensis]
MQIPQPVLDVGADVAAWLTSHGQPLLFGAGAVGATLALLLVWRFLRTGEVHERLGTAAVTLATLFAMEGMYEVARGSLRLPVGVALVFCATFELVMLHQGSLAAHKLATAGNGPAPDISRHMRMVWIVAIASGVIASTAAHNLTEAALRLATPPLAAGIWYMSLHADKQRAERQPSRWIWTPQRVGVRLGLLKPGTVDDLGEVFRQRRIDALVEAGMHLYAEREAARLHSTDERTPPAEATKASRWRWRWQPQKGDPLADALRRVQRLTKSADADTVAAAREQLRRVLSIGDELFRDDRQPTERERQLMDELTIAMRQVTTNLRADHRAAYAEPTTTIGGIRMPATVAARIPDEVPAEWLAQHRVVPTTAAPEPTTTTTTTPEPTTTTATVPATKSTTRRRRTVVAKTDRPPATSGTEADRTAAAYASFLADRGRPPTGSELAAIAGVSKSYANNWKRANTGTATTDD